MRCLATVRQKKTRVGIAQPADLDRSSAECPDVCEESFDTSEAEQDAAETSPRMIFATDEVVECIVGIETLQYRVVVPAEISPFQ